MLNLLRLRRQLLADDTHVMLSRVILGRGCFSRRRGLSADIVEVILAIDTEVWMLELKDLSGVSLGRTDIVNAGILRSP